MREGPRNGLAEDGCEPGIRHEPIDEPECDVAGRGLCVRAGRRDLLEPAEGVPEVVELLVAVVVVQDRPERGAGRLRDVQEDEDAHGEGGATPSATARSADSTSAG